MCVLTSERQGLIDLNTSFLQLCRAGDRVVQHRCQSCATSLSELCNAAVSVVQRRCQSSDKSFSQAGSDSFALTGSR